MTVPHDKKNVLVFEYLRFFLFLGPRYNAKRRFHMYPLGRAFLKSSASRNVEEKDFQIYRG